MKRRDFIKGSLSCSALSLIAQPAVASRPTPDEAKGPFYPIYAQKDKDFDLTTSEEKQGIAKGIIIIIQGRVLDTEGNPIEDATVDLWQANTHGRYRHPHDSNKAPLDPNFEGWAIVASAKDGNFRFKTIYPGTYPASSTWQRPPHIHFKVIKKAYAELITQMYFPGHKLNERDLLLTRKPRAEQKLMIASRVQSEPETYEYNIVMQKV